MWPYDFDGLEKVVCGFSGLVPVKVCLHKTDKRGFQCAEGGEDGCLFAPRGGQALAVLHDDSNSVWRAREFGKVIYGDGETGWGCVLN